MAVSSEYVLLNTAAFDAFLAQKDKIPARYTALATRFDTAVATLLRQWKGEGADAFAADSTVLQKNMTALDETLSTLCATMADIHELLQQQDARLGQSNRDAV